MPLASVKAAGSAGDYAVTVLVSDGTYTGNGNRDLMIGGGLQYLRGRDISEVISTRKSISFRVLVDVYSQTLDALAYIHTRQIAHCDIKPENIFITKRRS